eukprot:2202354-Prymnesium_polylepis.1
MQAVEAPTEPSALEWEAISNTLLKAAVSSFDQLGGLFYECPGLTLNVPDPVQKNYPFGIHGHYPNLPWVFDFISNSVRYAPRAGSRASG